MNSTVTQEMDREDEEGMVIYANADIVFNDDRRTGVEDSDTKRQRMLQGAGSVRSRMYGAAAVCLVLMCVLMTVIITLRVQLSTETHKCKIEINNFREQLHNNYIDLMEEISQLKKENTDLKNKKDQLQTVNQDLISKREQLVNENTRLKNKGAQLEIKIANNYTDLMEERNQSPTENTKLSSYTNWPKSNVTTNTSSSSLTYK